MTDPKRRSPATLRAHQRQRQAGGPHDEGRTRGEEERMAIEEGLNEDPIGALGLSEEVRECLREIKREVEAAYGEDLDRLAAENAALRATVERAWGVARALEHEAAVIHRPGDDVLVAVATVKRDAADDIRAALDSGGERGEGGDDG